MPEFDFVAKEKEILRQWQENRIFEKSMAQRKDSQPFVFFEGPPTANGMPHIGHFLTRIYKDLYGRYKTMRGYYVERRAGWDTQGLPVEIEIEKELGLKSKKDIEQYGIAAFNRRAKESVWKYKGEWERMTERMGFWLDLSKPYITYENNYIESVWWILKQLWDKKLLFQGHKVLPYCYRCGTVLSSHEVAQGYRTVTDNSVYVKFKVKPGQKVGEWAVLENTYILAWTTTPWTLPGNLALAVGEQISYDIITRENETLIVASERRTPVLGEHVSIQSSVVGKELVGLAYEPLFEVKPLQSGKSYQVYAAKFVTTTDGTGIVHTAVMYGEDDYELGKELDLPKHHTVDLQGRFTADVAEFAGRPVKNEKTEKEIIEYLNQKGLLLKTEPYEHEYPHCWRCKTALLYYARDSWFIRMSSLRPQLLEQNQTINWVPAHMRDGRFGEFLKEAKDWALSRERYWGTPLPLWQCETCHQFTAIGSLNDLELKRFRIKNKFLVMRHGQSLKNADGNGGEELISSRLESDEYPLTQEGRERVTQTAQALKASGGVDLIFASPFKRTQETANIVGEILGVPVITEARLSEIRHASMCEDRSKHECPLTKDERTMDSRPADGESYRDVKVRMATIVRELDAIYEGKRILLVSHGDPIWQLRAFVSNLSDEETLSQRPGLLPQKASVTEIDFKNYPYDDAGNLDVHRPYIDSIALKCEHCGGKALRIPDLGDVWLDSGAMPLAQWHYPFENQHRIDNPQGADTQYPADWIVEGLDQTRGWYYSMLALATALGRPAPYRNVGALGFVTNDQGKKLSKSEGAGEGFAGILDTNSVDALRWYFYTVSDLGDGKRFSLTSLQAKFRSFNLILLNSLRFYDLYPAPRNAGTMPEARTALDRWLWARLNEVKALMTRELDAFQPTPAARALEDFIVADISQWWLRLSRERFQRPRADETHQYVSDFYRGVLLEVAKLLAPFMPFFAEYMHVELHRNAGPMTESVHLHDWPYSENKIYEVDTVLIKAMDQIRVFVTAGLAQRKARNIKVRQPLASVTLKRQEAFDPELEVLIKEELNVKAVLYDNQQESEAMLDENLTAELKAEGYARELVRAIQDLRKQAGYGLQEKIKAYWQASDPAVVALLRDFGNQIIQDTLLSSLEQGDSQGDVAGIAKLTTDLEIKLALKR